MDPIFGLFWMAASLFSPDTLTPSDSYADFQVTWYYVAYEDYYKNETRDTPVRDMKGKRLALVSRKFKADLDMQGTGKLRDGRLLNFAGTVKGDSRYWFSNRSPWGIGIGSCELEPFRTIAVDPKVIRPGSLVEIEETRGMILEDGSVHDGLWRAEDVGAAIKGRHIDLFSGYRGLALDTLKRNHLNRMLRMHIRVVKNPPRHSCVRE